MHWPRESWPWLGSLGLVAGLVAINVVVGGVLIAIGIAAHLVTKPLLGPQNATFLISAQLLTYVPVVAFVALVAPRVAHRTPAEIGLRAPHRRDVAIGVVGAAAMFLAVAIVSQIVSIGGVKSTEQSVEIFKEIHSTAGLAIFASVAILFAPIAEEMMFRVVLFNAIRRYQPTAVAAILSGIVFGLLHLDGATVPQLLAVSLPLVFVGVILAYVYAISGCYWSNVIAHGTFNALSVVGILVFHQT